MHHIRSGESPTVEVDTQWGAEWGAGPGDSGLRKNLCVLYRVPSCTNGPASSSFTCDSAVPLTKEAKRTSSLLGDFRFGHLAAGTLASIMAKGSAFSIVHCQEKTRHRPACYPEGMRG